MPFISIEGVDGSGKTEQVKLLVKHLIDTRQSVLQTKEPDGGHLGKEVREILTHPDRKLAPIEQLLLVSAARFDHVRSIIRPALANGQWVISDRFIDSTYAFQIAVSKTDLHPLFRSIHDIVIGPTLPDLTVILDLPLEVAFDRRKKRQDDNVDPAEEIRDFATIRNGLLKVSRENPDRCHIIDANQEPDAVARDIWKLVEGLQKNPDLKPLEAVTYRHRSNSRRVEWPKK